MWESLSAGMLHLHANANPMQKTELEKPWL